MATRVNAPSAAGATNEGKTTKGRGKVSVFSASKADRKVNLVGSISTGTNDLGGQGNNVKRSPERRKA